MLPGMKALYKLQYGYSYPVEGWLKVQGATDPVQER